MNSTLCLVAEVNSGREVHPLFDRDSNMSLSEEKVNDVGQENEQQVPASRTVPHMLYHSGGVQPPDVEQQLQIRLGLQRAERARIATLNTVLPLIAVAMGSLAVVIAVLVAYDSRAQLHEIRFQMQLEKVRKSEILHFKKY